MALPDATYSKAIEPGGTGFVRLPPLITFYRLLCPACGTLNVGDDVYNNWREGQRVTCRKCELTSMPETRKVDLAV